jgi:predicted ArsR family transcriptional regulator
MLDLFSFQLAESLGIDEAGARGKLDRLLTQHETEWKAFMGSLGSNSFLVHWTAGARE